jgi:hypothetical protein
MGYRCVDQKSEHVLTLSIEDNVWQLSSSGKSRNFYTIDELREFLVKFAS